MKLTFFFPRLLRNVALSSSVRACMSVFVRLLVVHCFVLFSGFVFWGFCVSCFVCCVFRFFGFSVFRGGFVLSGGRRSSRGHSRAARRGAPRLVPRRDRPPQAAEGHGRPHSIATKGLTTRWGTDKNGRRKAMRWRGLRDTYTEGFTQKREIHEKKKKEKV